MTALVLQLLQQQLLLWVTCPSPAAAWGCVLPTPAAPETEGPMEKQQQLVWSGLGAAARQG
jgi:hypothetical protein